MMRTFFAITPPPQTIIAIDEWRRLNWPQLERYIPASNFHLTLAFVGETSDKHVASLHEQLLPTRHSEFTLTLGTIGFWQKAGIFWLGTNSLPTAMTQLVKSINSACHTSGLALEKREYVPHLTLSRRCTTLPSPPVVEPQFTFSVDHYCLFESVKNKDRVVYQPLFTQALTAT